MSRIERNYENRENLKNSRWDVKTGHGGPSTKLRFLQTFKILRKLHKLQKFTKEHRPQSAVMKNHKRKICKIRNFCKALIKKNNIKLVNFEIAFNSGHQWARALLSDLMASHFGCFPFNQNSKNSKTGANGTEISRGKFPEFPKRVKVLGHLRSLSIRPNFLEIPGGGANWKEIFCNFISEFWIYLVRLS